MEQAIEFVPLDDYPDYEILSQYPFTIRRKDNHYVVSEILKNDGYLDVRLGEKTYKKHVLIAKQFIPNDDPTNKIKVDHINHIKTDYHLENLRWATISENSKNCTSHKGIVYEFVDDIPNDAIIIDYYDTKKEHHVFKQGDYYYYYDKETGEDIFYARITDKLYRVMYIQTIKNGMKRISLTDINNKKVIVYIHSFKFQYCLE